MNPTRIDWADYTWNPITGCLKGCGYCYAKKIAERFRGSKAFPKGFDPLFHQDRLFEPGDLKEPATIFVGSMTDVFGYWVHQEWIEMVFLATKARGQMLPHDFLFLTKNPERMAEFNFPPNCWAGFTATDQAMWDEGLEATAKISALRTFVSCEPLLGPVKIEAPKGASLPDWVIVGALTGPQVEGLKAPDQAEVWEWTASIIQDCFKLGIPCLIKRNVELPEPAEPFLSMWTNLPKEELVRLPDPVKRAEFRLRDVMAGASNA